MSISTKSLNPSVIVLAMCIIMPTIFSAPIDHKIYVVRTSLSNLTDREFVYGVESTINEDGREIYKSAFGVVGHFWDHMFESLLRGHVNIVEIPMEQLPFEGLLKIVQLHPATILPNLWPILKSTKDFSQKKLDETIREAWIAEHLWKKHV